MADITVYGTGYVGSVTAACLAELGHNVIGFDIDGEKIEQLQHGRSPIYEPGLQDLLQNNLGQNLTFTNDINKAATWGDIQFIAVGTPSSQDGSADLSYVINVARTIGQYANRPVTVVNKSTVPVGTCHKVQTVINDEFAKRGRQHRCTGVSNPEFLREGSAVQDFMDADRIVIGVDEQTPADDMAEVYRPLTDKGIQSLYMDVLSAELAKYASNAFLAAKISLVNEFSELAEARGADITKISEAMGMDERIGKAFLRAGCGYGGSCFPKDVSAMKQMIESNGKESDILQAVESVNERRKHWPYQQLKTYCQDLSQMTVAVWGLAFKPHTDDLREAASRVIIEDLWQQRAKVKAHDPVAMEQFQKLYPDNPLLQLCETADDALQGADALLIVTEWPEYAERDPDSIKALLNQPLVIDGRNIFNTANMAQAGMIYISVGRAITNRQLLADIAMRSQAEHQ